MVQTKKKGPRRKKKGGRKIGTRMFEVKRWNGDEESLKIIKMPQGMLEILFYSFEGEEDR